jgi:hypothetical protein
VIKPLVTADWWEKVLAVIEALTREVPCYRMEFDKSGAIVESLEELVHSCRRVETAADAALGPAEEEPHIAKRLDA